MPTRALIVVPENNTTMAPEMAALCPRFAPMAAARGKRLARTLAQDDPPAYADPPSAAQPAPPYAVWSTARAMADARHDAGVASTAIVPPYLPPVNAVLRAYLAASGIR